MRSKVRQYSSSEDLVEDESQINEVRREKLRDNVLIRFDCSLKLLHGLIPPCDLDFFFVLVGFKLLPVPLHNEGGGSPHTFIEHAKRLLVDQDDVVTNGESLSEEVVMDEVSICGM